jgi:hypothetical protein
MSVAVGEASAIALDNEHANTKEGTDKGKKAGNFGIHHNRSF